MRRTIADNFSLDQVTAMCDADGTRHLQSYDDLTMGDYQSVLQNQQCWNSLKWPLDRSTFIARLAVLREVRNDLVHFNPDPLPENTVQGVKHMIQLLKRYGSGSPLPSRGSPH